MFSLHDHDVLTQNISRVNTALKKYTTIMVVTRYMGSASFSGSEITVLFFGLRNQILALGSGSLSLETESPTFFRDYFFKAGSGTKTALIFGTKNQIFSPGIGTTEKKLYTSLLP